MGDGFYFIDILIFAMIAAFLVYRLRSVLGRRTGEERQRPNPFAAPRPGQARDPDADKVIPMPDRGPGDRGGAPDPPAPPPAVPAAAPAATSNEPASLAAGLAQVHAADPSFEEKSFLQGATAAFEMIVTAFAKGDTPTLRPLLSDDVHDSFAGAIRERASRGETLETRIERLRDADLIEARVDGRTALITIKFVSDQINATRDAQGTVLDGHADHAQEVVDIWTFARNTRSRNPNWTLVETRVPN